MENEHVAYRELINYPLTRFGSDGSIWSSASGEWKPRKFFTMPSGYLAVSFRKTDNYKNRTRLVHRLILEAFRGPCPDGMQTLHDNGIKGDNRITNLRWGTRKENCADKIRHGVSNRGERHGHAFLTERIIRQIRSDYATGLYTYVTLGAKHLIAPQTAHKIVTRKAWGHVK